MQPSEPEDILRTAQRALRSVAAQRLRPDDWAEFDTYLVTMRQLVDRNDLAGIAKVTAGVMNLSGRRQQRRIDPERVAPTEPTRTTAEQLGKELAELAKKFSK